MLVPLRGLHRRDRFLLQVAREHGQHGLTLRYRYRLSTLRHELVPRSADQVDRLAVAVRAGLDDLVPIARARSLDGLGHLDVERSPEVHLDVRRRDVPDLLFVILKNKADRRLDVPPHPPELARGVDAEPLRVL